MPKPVRTPAIVIRRQDFMESSRLVQLVTRDYGRLTFLARGAHRARSPFLGAIDLLHVCEAHVQVRQGRGIQALYGLRVLRGNTPFRRDAVRRGLAVYMADLVRLAMPEGRPDAEMFDVFHGALLLFAQAPARCLATVDVGVKLRVLQVLGLLPGLDTCPRSGARLPATGKVGFVPAAGGFVVPQPGERLVAAELPRLAAQLVSLDGRTLARTEAPAGPLADLHDRVHDLLFWHLGDRPRPNLPEQLFAPGGRGRRIGA